VYALEGARQEFLPGSGARPELGQDRSRQTVLNATSCTYKDYADANRLKALNLTGVEFIRRLRLHLIPRGFTKTRHCGLLGNNRRHRRVPAARAALETSPLRFAPITPMPGATPACPHCRSPDLRCIGRVDRSGKLKLFASPILLSNSQQVAAVAGESLSRQDLREAARMVAADSTDERTLEALEAPAGIPMGIS